MTFLVLILLKLEGGELMVDLVKIGEFGLQLDRWMCWKFEFIIKLLGGGRRREISFSFLRSMV